PLSKMINVHNCVGLKDFYLRFYERKMQRKGQLNAKKMILDKPYYMGPEKDAESGGTKNFADLLRQIMTYGMD
ncbi:unnamed protein product, partial [Allacma fusca]